MYSLVSAWRKDKQGAHVCKYQCTYIHTYIHTSSLGTGWRGEICNAPNLYAYINTYIHIHTSIHIFARDWLAWRDTPEAQQADNEESLAINQWMAAQRMTRKEGNMRLDRCEGMA